MKKNVMEKYQGFLSTLDNTQSSNDGSGTEREVAENVFRAYHIFKGDMIAYCCKDYENFHGKTKKLFTYCPFCGKKVII